MYDPNDVIHYVNDYYVLHFFNVFDDFNDDHDLNYYCDNFNACQDDFIFILSYLFVFIDVHSH